MRALLIGISVLLACLLCLGCQNASFHYVRPLTDQNFKDEIIYDERPAVILFHTGLNSVRTQRLIAPFETYAKAFNDKVRVFSYDMSQNKRYADKYRVRRRGSTFLFYKSQPMREVVDFLKDDRGVLARLYMLTDVFTVEDNPLGKQIPARDLKAKDVERELLETERLVVIAFDRVGAGDSRGHFEPQLSELSMRYGSYVTFFRAEGRQLRRRFKIGNKQTLLVYKKGREVVRYTGPLYANSIAMKTRLVGLMLPYLDGCEHIGLDHGLDRVSPSSSLRVLVSKELTRGSSKPGPTLQELDMAALIVDESHLFTWTRKPNRTRKRKN